MNTIHWTLMFTHFLSDSAVAGGEYSEEELAQWTEQCNAGTSGFACMHMAETTLCGVGFNEGTAVWVNKANAGFEAACQKGVEEECIGLAHGHFKCTGYDFSSQIFSIDSHHQPCPRKAEESDAKAHQINVDFLIGQCNKGMLKMCTLAGEYFMYGENNIVSSDQLRNQKAIPPLTKACEGGNPDACALLSIAHQLEHQRTNKQVCKKPEFNIHAPYFKDLCSKSILGY